MYELKRLYDRIDKQKQLELQNIFNSIDFGFEQLYNIASKKTKDMVNVKITEWKDKGLLTGYFGILAKSIYNRTRVKNSEILELLIYGAYIEEQSKLQEQELNIMYDDVNYYYQEGQQEVNDTLPKKERKPIDILKWALFLALLDQPNVTGFNWEQYVEAIIKYNAEQIYKQVVINIQQNQENNIDDIVFQNIINKQQNAKLCINGNKISGAVDIQLIGMNNCAKIEGIKSIDSKAKVKFISVNDEHRTKMCESLEGQIFNVNDYNEFSRYDGTDGTYKKYRCLGLIVGLNCPPINSTFHWCRSSLTYQLDFNSEDLYYGNHLSDDEYESINRYLKSYSYKINSALYNKEELTKEQKDYIEKLDFALSKMPKYNGIVFRSVYVKDNDELNKILSIFNNNSKIGSWDSYISSSKGIYDESFNLQLKINSKTGRDLSRLNDEGKGEVIFLRNTQFELKDIYSLNRKIIASLEEV